jgi:hypothetical protein
MVDFVQFPPDSTGKKSRHMALTELTLSSELIQANEGDVITGALSSASGIFVGSTRQGQIVYFLKNVTGAFQAGETLNVGIVPHAVLLNTTGNIYTATSSIVDSKKPTNALTVDDRGAAAVRFTEGEPQFDAFGRIQVAQMQVVAEYYHVSEDHPGKFWTQSANGGSVTYVPQASSMLYQTGTTNGALASRTTNQYHPYKPGTSQLIYTAVALGDEGKANVVREWGYYDDYNGVGLRLNGTTLQAFMRSDVSGSITEEVVDQDDWNGNKLNDLAVYDYLLDVSKFNTYWIDIGAGRLRVGVITPDARRIVLHEFRNANSANGVFVRSYNLPIRWRQKNVGAAASTSEMRVSYGVVFTESSDIKYTGVLIHTSPPDPVSLPKDNTYKPFLNFRAKLTINGLPNRIIGIHEDFDWCSIGNSPIHIGIFVLPNDSSLTGVNWSSTIVPTTMLEVDRSATSFDINNATLVESFIAGPNSSGRIHLGDRIEKSFGLAADGVTQAVFVFAARALDPTVSGDCKLFYTKYWKEIR